MLKKLTPFTITLTMLVVSSSVAEEEKTFPPLKPLRIGRAEFRASTQKRGLAILSKEPFPPKVVVIPGTLVVKPGVVRTVDKKDDGPHYRGTVVRLKKGLVGEEEKVQEAFASLFPKADPCPEAQTAHFDWLPHYDAFPVRNIGWNAAIQRLERDQEGMWTVTVHLTPELFSWNIMTYQFDFVEETYQFDEKSIRLVSSDAKNPKPKLQMFPTAL